MDPELSRRLNEIKAIAQKAADNAEAARSEASDKGHFFIIIILFIILLSVIGK